MDLKKGFDETIQNIVALSKNCLEVYKNPVDRLGNSLWLNEISLLIFFQFYCIINKKQVKTLLETIYGLNP